MATRSGVRRTPSDPEPVALSLLCAYAPERVALHDLAAQAKLRAFADANGLDMTAAAELLVSRGFDACASPDEREAARAHERRAREARREADQHRDASTRQAPQRDRRAEIRAAMLAAFRRRGVMTSREVTKLVSGNSQTKEDVLRELVENGVVEGVGRRNGGFHGYRLAAERDDDDEQEERTA